MSELAIISVDKELSPIREKNLFLNIIVSNFIWMIFHFSVFFFFTFQLKSVALVWIFLWIWNLFALLLDIPIWIIQKYYKPRTLFIISYISQILAMLIFINFTLQITDFIKEVVVPEDMWIITITLEFFLWNWLNLLLLLIASFCYWLTKELQEVTMISYILNNANHNQYIGLIANKNISTWIWAFLWLLLSWYILTLNPNFIIILTIIIIIWIIYFTLNFFDNSEKTLSLQDVYKFKVLLDKDHIKNLHSNLTNTVIKTVNKIELKGIVWKSKYIFLKPVTLQPKIDFRALAIETKKEFIATYKIFTNTENSMIIYWCLVMLVTFWFWDTFASTFLIKFLDDLLEWWWYMLLWVVAVPAFWLQWYFSKLSEQYWIAAVSNIWLVLSWSSLFLMGVFSWSDNLLLIMAFAIINSVWYAACMTLSQAWFLESYNKAFANYNKLKEIDANASAAPLKIIQNLANVVWLFLWWLILSVLNYIWFFMLFGVVIIYILYWTIKNHITDKEKE